MEFEPEDASALPGRPPRPRRAELVFFTGPMDSGKSTLALQMDHTQSSHDRQGRLFTCRDRAGTATITSRIGLRRPAVEVNAALDFFAHVVDELTSGARIEYLVCDEAQFYAAEQIDQLSRVVDELGIDVYCFGILADFRTRLFPGSMRLVELADRVEWPQVQPLCWCGEKATTNARTVNGRMVTEGAQGTWPNVHKSWQPLLCMHCRFLNLTIRSIVQSRESPRQLELIRANTVFHEKILAAIVARDPEAASRLMAEH